MVVGKSLTQCSLVQGRSNSIRTACKPRHSCWGKYWKAFIAFCISKRLKKIAPTHCGTQAFFRVTNQTIESHGVSRTKWVHWSLSFLVCFFFFFFRVNWYRAQYLYINNVSTKLSVFTLGLYSDSFSILLWFWVWCQFLYCFYIFSVCISLLGHVQSQNGVHRFATVSWLILAWVNPDELPANLRFALAKSPFKPISNVPKIEAPITTIEAGFTPITTVEAGFTPITTVEVGFMRRR